MQLRTTDDLESIKTNVRLIKRAGTHAEIFGWVLFICGIAGVWIFNNKVSAVAWTVVLFACAVYFILSGKYIKAGFGRRTKLALLINTIIAFPLSFAVLPIYICVQSSNNYSRFKDLPEKIRLLFVKQRWPRISIIDGVCLALVLVLGISSLLFKFNQLNIAAHKAALSAIKPKPVIDTTTRWHFTISAPGTVTESDFTQQENNHTVTYATISSTAGKDKGDFKVYAYYYSEPPFKYSAMSATDLAKAVHKTLTSLVQTMHGSISQTTPATFAGSSSEEAEFTDQTFAGTNTGYIRVFFMQNYEYAVISIGSGRDAFTNYANSFRFTGA